MNIEEERNSFLIECRSMMGNAYYPTDTGFSNGEFCDTNVQRLFAVWLKASAQRDEGLAREAELRGEIERLKGLPHGQILAEAAARHLLDTGAENFVGEVFTIDADDGQTQFEIVVTTQKVGAKSPGEVCNDLQQRLAEAHDLLTFVKKCLVKNGEYAPLSHYEIDKVLGIGGFASPGCADGEKQP